MSQYSVILDANVLYPAPLRDILVEAAYRNIYRARWTEKIHEEWIENLLEDRPDLSRSSLERTRLAMDNAIEDCLITGYESIIDVLDLPDPDDRHVLAAAIVGRCDAIVTSNLKHFPKDVCMSFGIEPIDPDTFLYSQMDLATGAFCEAVKTVRQKLRNPPKTVDEYLQTLKQQDLVILAAALEQYAGVL
ncbi:MAG: PIN domain-containing protein [Deinococcota bacterium]